MVEAQWPVGEQHASPVGVAPRLTMKLKLGIRKKGATLYEHALRGSP
jgi:hypothetical protein